MGEGPLDVFLEVKAQQKDKDVGLDHSDCYF